MEPRDFYEMNEADMAEYCGADGRKWAEAFCKIKEGQGWSSDDIDIGLMTGWFASAIERSSALRLSAQRREPVVRVKELVWEDADEGMCTKWRACALGGHYELVALDGDGGGLAVNFHWGRPLSFWFIQGEPDEWGPTGPKMFPTLDAAKSAAQADYEQRIMAAICREDR